MTKGEAIARKLVECVRVGSEGYECYQVPIGLMAETIEALKDVEERKTGHWVEIIDYGNHRHLRCSCCGNERWKNKYCSECGAEMEGSEEDG